MNLPLEDGAFAPDRSAAPNEAPANRRRGFDIARAAWPTLDVSFEAFCRHLEDLGYRQKLPSQLGALYLCTACSEGCARACQLLEARHFPALRAFVAKFDRRPEVVDDLLQQIRYRLLVGPNPRIRSYRGEGSFDGWLRRVASSVAIDTLRADSAVERHRHRLHNEQASFEQCHGAPPLPPDEELHQGRCVRTLQGAVSHALQTLSKEHRQLLYHYYVSELTIDQLGAMYGCHRSAAARRVVKCVAMVQRSLQTQIRLRMPGGLDMEGWARALDRTADFREMTGH